MLKKGDFMWHLEAASQTPHTRQTWPVTPMQIRNFAMQLQVNDWD